MANRKIHLRANKLTETNSPRSVCSSFRTADGKCKFNGRDKYRFMASEIVGFMQFREVPAADRCAHCVDNGLIIRNRIRKERGFTQVTSINDAFTDKE